MQKKIYTFGTMAMMATASVFAQTVIDSDMVCDGPYDWGDLGDTELIIAGATITVADEPFNVCGFNPNGTITLMEGGKVKFFDSPETAYPDPELYSDYTDYMLDATGSPFTAIPFNWIIDGTGNEIWLDSYCSLGGTITGTGDLTIYIGSQNTFDFDSWYSAVDPATYTGTLSIKVMDAYKSDTVTLRIGDVFPGHTTDGVSFTKTSGQWGSVPFTLDVTGAENLYIRKASGSSAWPAIIGECDIYTGTSYSFVRNATPCGYDVNFSGCVESRDFEVYAGANVAFNKPVESVCSRAYHRNGFLMAVNSQEPSFANCVNGLSGRNTNSAFGGNGYIASSVAGKDGSTINIKPGQGDGNIGTLTVDELWLYNNNGLSIDMDASSSTCDKIVLVDSAVFQGANTRVWLNLMDNFFSNPVCGNYSVLDGKTVTAMSGINDTTGYYVVDSSLVFVNVNTGDTVTYFSNVKPGAGNREIDTLGYWGLGTGGYGTDLPYTSSPNKIDAATWAATYSTAAREAIAAREFVPGTGDSIAYTGHVLTATDLPIKEAYDYEYNFNLVVKNNETNLVGPTGDSIKIGRDLFNFTFKQTDSLNNIVYRYNSNAVAVPQTNGDTINYWFDFTNFFTKGYITLCSDVYPSFSDSDVPVNGVSDGIQTTLKEMKSVKARTIYTIDGARVNQLVKGLNIITTQYTDGSIETRKAFFNE